MSDTFGSKVYRIQADAFFVATDDGVWLRNNSGSFSIKGKSSYLLIRSLFSKLDGKHTVDDLCNGLASDRRNVIEQLISTLEKRNFIKHVILPEETLPTWAQQLYGDQINFIDQCIDHAPFERFMNFRSKRVLVIGHGTVLRSSVVALVEAGAGYVEVRPTAMSMEEATVLAQIVESAIKRDPYMQMSLHPEPIKPASKSLAMVEEPNCVLFVSDSNCPTDLGHLYTLARESSLIFGTVFPLGDLLIASPLFTPDTPLCWECMYRSIYAPTTSSLTSHNSLPPAPAALACYQLVHHLFCHYTGLSLEEGHICTIVDCTTLAVKEHRVFQHPICSHHSPPDTVIARTSLIQMQDQPMRPDLPRSDDPVEIVRIQDDIVSRAAHWTDDTVGPFLYVGEDDLGQIPLSASRCVTRAPLSAPGALDARTIICRGLSAREARNQVVLLGLEWLALEILKLGNLETANQEQILFRIYHLSERIAESQATPTYYHIIAGNLFPPLSIGAGWSPYEAAYRALSHSSFHWAPQVSGRSPCNQTALIASLRNTLIGPYLFEILANFSNDDPRVAVDLAPTGFFVSTASLDSGSVGYGTGLSGAQASLNALMDLTSKYTNTTANWESDVHSVHLTLDIGSWKEALARAESMRTGWGMSVSYWDVRQLLPFGGGDFYIIGIQLLEN